MTKIKAKATLHPRNIHQGKYNLEELTKTFPKLKNYIIENKTGQPSVAFANPDAVKALNTSLLLHFYNLNFWDIPEGYLCPPIPGRADYIHIVADLIGKENNNITCLDIGTGANLVYPIIGSKVYDWKFVASEIDEKAIEAAQEIINKNKRLTSKIILRKQTDSNSIFKNIINTDEQFEAVICNPPFHTSQAKAEAGTARKLKNLNGNKAQELKRNFGGQHNELWCVGGEKKFISTMVTESLNYKQQCNWFTTLVSDYRNLEPLYKALKKVNAKEVKTINMGQGNKVSRVLAWRFN